VSPKTLHLHDEPQECPKRFIEDTIVSFVFTVLIAIVAGLLAQRIWRTPWISKQIAGPHRDTVASALVGIAGSFIGFHFGILLNLVGNGSIVLFIRSNRCRLGPVGMENSQIVEGSWRGRKCTKTRVP
jgi:hypothetical protein